MVTKHKAVTKRKRSRSQKFRKAVPGKPQGVIQARVQAVGPERFGIVAVDCAKAGSKWMLVDFYGNVLCQPANVEHNRSAFQLAALTLRQAVEKHDFKDIIVAVEMTSSYHKPPMRAFRGAGFETRLGDQRSHPVKHQSNKKTRVDFLRSLTGEKEQAGCVEGGGDSRDKTQSLRDEWQSEPRFFIRGIATPSLRTNRRIQQEKAERAEAAEESCRGLWPHSHCEAISSSRGIWQAECEGAGAFGWAVNEGLGCYRKIGHSRELMHCCTTVVLNQRHKPGAVPEFSGCW